MLTYVLLFSVRNRIFVNLSIVFKAQKSCFSSPWQISRILQSQTRFLPQKKLGFFSRSQSIFYFLLNLPYFIDVTCSLQMHNSPILQSQKIFLSFLCNFWRASKSKILRESSWELWFGLEAKVSFSQRSMLPTSLQSEIEFCTVSKMNAN